MNEPDRNKDQNPPPTPSVLPGAAPVAPTAGVPVAPGAGVAPVPPAAAPVGVNYGVAQQNPQGATGSGVPATPGVSQTQDVSQTQAQPDTPPQPDTQAQPGGITTQNVARSFGDVHAVVDVSFTAPPGAITALVGANGSGKTTLLLMLAGLLAADRGTISVNGFDPVTNPKNVHASIGWMPDVLGSWDSLTCREVLVTFAKAYGIPKTNIEQRVYQILQQLHLVELGNAPARVLSRGQKQRLGLARAIIHDPPVLLLDEPASGLDPRSRIELRDLLRGLAASGKTILISSHVLSELDELCDHAVFMSYGRTVNVDATVQQRNWRIRTLDINSLIAELQNLAVPMLNQVGSEVTVTLADDQAAAKLLAHIVSKQIPVTDFAQMNTHLEQAFLTLEADRR